MQLTTLSKMLSGRMTLTPSGRTTSVLILDSCPGQGTLASSKRAFTHSIQSSLVRFVIGIFLTLFYYQSLISAIFFGKKRYAQVLKESLQHPRLLPWTDIHTPRLYIFSKTDQMIPWQEVQAHAQEASRIGFKVETKIFENTPHVAHMRSNPALYWTSVGNIWKEACQAEEHEM